VADCGALVREKALQSSQLIPSLSKGRSSLKGEVKKKHHSNGWSSLKGEVKKKHHSNGWSFSCFAAHWFELDLF
jgi:hypothetical protein